MNLQSGLSECSNCQAKNGLNLIVANITQSNILYPIRPSFEQNEKREISLNSF